MFLEKNVPNVPKCIATYWKSMNELSVDSF